MPLFPHIDRRRNPNHAVPIGPRLHPARAVLETGLRVLFVLLGLAATTSLVAEFGFPLSPETEELVHIVNVIVFYGFITIVVGRGIQARNKKEYVLSHWLDISLALLICVHLVFPQFVRSILVQINPSISPEVLARVYVILTEILILLAFIPSAIRYSTRLMTFAIQPSTLIACSFSLLIVLGTALLLLPRASTNGGMSFVDALFTATSAVCVTGLSVVDTATTFTPTGQVILLVLIQVGGLGIMTFTTFFAYVMGSKSALKQYSTLQSIVGEENIGRIRKTVLRIGLLTFVIEFAGAAAIFSLFDPTHLPQRVDRLFFAIFHSIAAFCNAGFALTTENFAHAIFRDNTLILVVIMGLVTAGGLGFPVLIDISRLLDVRRRPLERRLTLHAKLVLVTSGVLVLGGTIALFLLEQNNSMLRLSGDQRLVHSLFHAVSARTAGFNTLPLHQFAPASLLLLILLMWVGASPGSTGGGIKTTTFTLALLSIRAVVSGRNRVEVFRHRVSDLSMVRALSTLVLSLFFLATATFVLLLTEPFPFQAIAFEVVSALGTVGLSTGITPALSPAGKVLLSLTMFVGRVGVLAIVLALTKKSEQGRFEYTEEHVMIT